MIQPRHAARRNHAGHPSSAIPHRKYVTSERDDPATLIDASALKGVVVERVAGHGGRLRDLVAEVGEAGKLNVVAIVVRCHRRTVRIDATSIVEFRDSGSLTVTVEPIDQPSFVRRDGEVLLLRDLLDAEVIDRTAQRLVRVNDVVLAREGTVLMCTAINASPTGLLRRLLPHRFARPLKGETIPWDEVELTIEPPPGVDFGISYERLTSLHPADVATLIDHLPYRQGARILASLDAQFAAATLEEVERQRQPEILEYLPKEHAIAILDEMAPDAAADLLESVPRAKSDTLIALLQPETSSDIQLLLSYPQNSAAGLMTTEFVMALESETIAEAIERIRGQLERPHLVYYVYVVDDLEERRLQGIVSLREILLADPQRELRDIMSSSAHTTRPEEHCKEVARIMGEYNLLALPVVDDLGRMLGLVTADDVLDLMLPDSMRRHLPRLFS